MRLTDRVTDAVDFFLNHPGILARCRSPPRLKRTATLAHHLVEPMRDGRSHVDATCDTDTDPFEACLNTLGRIDKAHKELTESNPARIMTQLPCLQGQLSTYSIFAGDSSMALVDESVFADGTTRRVKRNAGEGGTSFVTLDREVRIGHLIGPMLPWGKGLEQIIDGVEF